MSVKNKLKIAVVDDRVFFLSGLASCAESMGYSVVLKCKNGLDFISKVDLNDLPAVVFMGINMPEMDGYETAAWIKLHCPTVKVLAISVDYNQEDIKKMAGHGANGFVMFDIYPHAIHLAIQEVTSTGSYYQEVDKGMQSSYTGKPYLKPW